MDSVVIRDATLYHGDCRELLDSLQGVDAVVTDPPYGIAFVKGSSGRKGAYRGSKEGHGRGTESIAGDAEPFDPTPLLRFDNVLTWGANHYCHRLPLGVGRWLAWNKLADLEPFDSFSDVEFAWHSIGKASRICNYMWKGGLATVKVGEDGERSHPTQKPIGLMSWCLLQVGQAHKILDPYMGSGTTGVACAGLGRSFVGIEIKRKYFDIACERIERAYSQQRLFA